MSRNGRLDVLYNNAASVHFAPVEELTPKLWTETLKGELDIVFMPTRAAWRHLARQGGSIINSASLSGMRPLEYIGATAHAASKGGAIAMTSSWRSKVLPTASAAIPFRPALSRHLRRSKPSKRTRSSGAISAVGRWGAGGEADDVA